LFDKRRSQQLTILSIINLSFLFKETFVTIVTLINVLLFVLLSKNLLLLTIKFTLKSKNTIIDKKVFANFFARAKKLVVNLFLIFKFQLSNFKLCKRQKIIEDNDDDLLKEFLRSSKLAYSDDDERELRELKRLLATRQR